MSHVAPLLSDVQLCRDTLRNKLKDPIESLIFPLFLPMALARRYGLGAAPQVSDRPHLTERGRLKWLECISGVETYLEYGGGGSTIAAGQHARRVVTVETDKRFLDAVAGRVRDLRTSAEFYPIHVDIGLTKSWGRPVVPFGSAARLSRWRDYATAPWRLLDDIGAVPQMIFVDGRFRVASVLESMIRLPDDADCRFMMDDFAGRGEMYGAVLGFTEGARLYDKTLAFRRASQFDREKCRETLERFRADPR